MSLSKTDRDNHKQYIDDNVRYAQAIWEMRLDVLRELSKKGIKPDINLVSDVVEDSRSHRELRSTLMSAGIDPNLNANMANFRGYVRTEDRTGYVELRNIILRSGIDPNQLDRRGKSLLSLAALCGDLESVKILLEIGADVNLSPEGPEGYDTYCDMTVYYPPLIAALAGGNPEVIVKIFLEQGADVNCRTKDEETALMKALELDEGRTTGETMDSPLLSILNHSEVDVNAVDSEGSSALSYAAFSKVDESIISLLIKKGADINAVNDDGDNALMSSYPLSHTSVVLFIDNGIDVNDVNNRGETLLTKCVNNTYRPKEINIFEYLQFLINNACLELADDSKFLHASYSVPLYLWSPLFTALKGNCINLARKIVRSNILTPFDLFVMPNHPEVRNELKQSGLSESLEFIDEMSSSVPSLFQLAFVKISAAVRFGRGRRKKVEQLPLPDLMKSKLNFCEDTT